jgi:hypothetical protein
MKNKNIVPLLLIAGAGYYFYTQSKKNKGIVTLSPLEKSSTEEFLKTEIVEQKPKTLFAKAAALVKKAASTPEGKSLLKKGVKAITQKKQLKKLGATYL